RRVICPVGRPRARGGNGLAVRLLAAKPFDILSGGQSDVAGAERLALRRERLLDGFLFEGRLVSLSRREIVTAAGKLGACRDRRLPEPLALRQFGGEEAGGGAAWR